MKRTNPRAALTLAGVLLLSGCGLGAEPEPTPTIPDRWGLDEVLPGAHRVEVRQSVREFAPRGCRAVSDELRMLTSTFAGPEPSFPFEFGRYVDGDLTVGYFVVWTDFESSTVYATAEQTATAIVGDLDRCVADVNDFRKYHGTWTFERFGSVGDLRFGWYESSAKPADWVERELVVSEREKQSPPRNDGPFQTQGRYAIVNGWLVVGVEASVEDETTDLPAAVDIDALLDHLVAEVKADPITKDEYRHRFDHLHEGDDDSGPRSPLDQLKDNVNPSTG